MFEGLDKKEVSGNSRHPALGVGDFVVRIEDVIFLKTRGKGDAFIVEYTVVESSNPEKDPVGAKRTWYQSYQDVDIAQGETLKFMYACLGFDAKRDRDRIKTEVTPNIKAWTFAACNDDPSKGRTKMLNGQGVNIRVNVWKKPPNAKALLKNKDATGWDTPSFSPASNEPPKKLA